MSKRQPTQAPERQPTPLNDVYSAFVLSRKAQNVTARTLKTYDERLGKFLAWCTLKRIATIESITPSAVRAYLVHLQQRSLSPWTVHGHARAVKTFLRFAADEEYIAAAPRFTMPQLPKEILPALEPAQVEKLLDACEQARDRVIMLMLLDTGCRASEFVALDGGDVDERTGVVRVRQGKGRKDRTVYLGTRTRRELIRYWRTEYRPGVNAPLWVSFYTGERLTHSGLRQLLRRVARRARVENVSPHVFRRTFATWALRSGMSLVHLQRILGHSDLQVLKQYLALVDADIQAAHQAAGPVDRMLTK